MRVFTEYRFCHSLLNLRSVVSETSFSSAFSRSGMEKKRKIDVRSLESGSFETSRPADTFCPNNSAAKFHSLTIWSRLLPGRSESSAKVTLSWSKKEQF